MESQEARLYRGETIVKQLCLIGYNDDIDEIIAQPDGTMTVNTIEEVKTDDGYSTEERTYTGITRISFK